MNEGVLRVGNTKRQLKLTVAQCQPAAVFAALDKSQEPGGQGQLCGGGSITLIKFVTTNANTTET